MKNFREKSRKLQAIMRVIVYYQLEANINLSKRNYHQG